MNGRLLIFARHPEPGRCKTRLIPALGAEGAAALHAALAARTLAWAARLPTHIAVDVLHTGDDPRWFQRQADHCGLRATIRPQAPGDLGAKLTAGFAEAFEAAREQPTRDTRTGVIVVGTDCPELEEELVADAFARLATHDAVIGPARDGGYYLLGLTRPAPSLLDDIPWSTAEVFHETTRRLDALRRRTALLPELADIDEPADLDYCRRLGIAVP